MDCFKWEAIASSHLDGLLPPKDAKIADLHLKDCKACSTKFDHYRSLLNQISSHKRSNLPESIRKNPASWLPHKLSTLGSASRWDRLPWYARSLLEGAGVAIVVFVILAMTPKIRQIYEQGLDRGMNPMNLKDLLGQSESGVDDAPKLSRGRELIDPQTQPDQNTAPEEDFVESEGMDEDTIIVDAGSSVGNGEIWRFNIRTDSPKDVQPRLTAALIHLGVAKQTPGLGGVEAPGGIQFDILVSKTLVQNLKNVLQKFAQTSPTSSPESSSTEGEVQENTTPKQEPFTWFRNRSKKQIPDGKTRVVIWLFQI